MIKIFKQEVRDGLDCIVNDNSFMLTSKATRLDHSELYQPSLDISKLSIANDLSGVAGLFPMKSILASVGKNLNDDIFLRKNLWDARNSPLNKPFNLMHDQGEIIGHITGSYIIDSSGEQWNSDEMPEDDFHLASIAVIYQEWIDAVRREKITAIINEIESTEKWYVSMECSFASFDYGLKNSDGEISVVERNEATAYLSKYLKRYGGNGVYEDYQVGRVLNGIRFLGKGLVDKPANPNSIIIKSNTFSKAETENENMTVTQDQLEAIKQELATAKAENEELKRKLGEETSKAKFDAYESQIQEKSEAIKNLESSLASTKEGLNSVSQKLNEIVSLYDASQAKLEETTKANSELAEKILAFEKEKSIARRSAMLSDVGVEDVESTVADLASLDDESFDKVVAMMKKTKGKMGKEEEDKEKEKMGKASDLSALDTASETSSASLSDIDSNNEDGDVATAAAKYFESFLKTSKITKK